MARVQVHDNEPIESAIRRFKRQVAREGIITDTKKHAFYLKPGERKRLKSQVARRRARKSMRKRTHDE
ncbi:MAG TPA: 30S ribosomal protein S21 [Blastocatellia bacterium]|nr:30S ribosomal protein S21 [Blastocatellia bacterium]